MGNKSSKSNTSFKYLIPLPHHYQKNITSEVYSLKSYNNTQSNTQSNPYILTNPQTANQQQKQPSKTPPNQQQTQSTNLQNYPPFLKHHVIILNKFQTKQYLNHLAYRNQTQFKEFIVQMPFGQIQKQQKYTKIHLYADQLILTLNQVFNLPFYDMSMVLYTTLIAYKYLYSYFGLFKIQANMIGFTRQAKTKVWLNHKLTKDKPLPIVSDINLKRNKQEQSYMVDDLITIFSNKVDKQTIPSNFTLLSNTLNIRTSRATRLGFSRVLSQQDLSKSTVSSLQNNLISDFSDCSFDKCLQYLQRFFNIQRPSFHIQSVNKTNQDQPKQFNIATKKPYKNFIQSISLLLKTNKQLTQQSSDLRNSRANININLKESIISNHNANNLSFKRTNNQNVNFAVLNKPTIAMHITNSHIIQPNSLNKQLYPVLPHPNSMIVKNITPQQNLIINKSKSKPKVTFNTSNNSLYQRIGVNPINSSSNSVNLKSLNSSLEKNKFNSSHINFSSPPSYQKINFSKNIATSQVHAIYSSISDQIKLKKVHSSQCINQNFPVENYQNQDKHDTNSIIDGVCKV